MSNYQRTDVSAEIIRIARDFDTAYKVIDEERYRNYNMMVTSLQWSKEDKDKLDSEGRPAFAYNLISPIIKVISGIEKMSRKKLSVVGRTNGDTDRAALMNTLLDYVLNTNGFDYHKSKAALDAIIARWGWIYTGFSYEDDPEGQVLVKRINPFRIRFDMDFTDPTLKDCKMLMDSAWYTLEEILTMYAVNDSGLWEEIEDKAKQYLVNEPEKRKKAVSSFMSRLTSMIGRYTGNKSRDSKNETVLSDSAEWYDSSMGRFKVLELHERRLQRQLYVFDPMSGQKINVSKDVMGVNGKWNVDKIQLIRAGYTDPIFTDELEKNIYVTTSIPAFDLIVQDAPYPVQNGNFMYTPIFAYDFHADPMNTQSVVDELIDLQSSYNKRRSTMLEYITRFAAVGYVAEEGAVDEFMDEWTERRIGGIKRVKQGHSIQPDSLPLMPPALAGFEQEDAALFEHVSGVNKAARGTVESSSETGKLFLAKRQQGEVMLQHLFDNMERAMMVVGRNIIDLAQKFITEERVIRITRDGENDYVTLNQVTPLGVVNDVSVGKYDLVISQQPYGVSAKETEYLKLIDLLNLVGKYNPQLLPELIPVVVKASESAYKGEILAVLNKLNAQAAQMQANPEQVEGMR